MKTFVVSAVFALAFGLVLTAQGAPVSQAGPQAGPDLSGRWNRASVNGPGADNYAWGPRVEIDQSGGSVTVRPDSGKPERHKLDGTETAVVVSVDGCRSLTRITKWLAGRDRVTVTTWLVTKSACFHGEDPNEPEVYQTGPVAVRDIRGGPRRLESITDVYREGDLLTVETTRAVPGDAPTTTTVIYRK